jgi:hypothetical protein
VTAAPADADFAALLGDVALAIERTVPAWRVRLGEAVARWRAEGLATAVLERALALPADPGTDALLATFAAAAERLRHLERAAVALDPRLAGAPCFRDPARVREAAAALATASAQLATPAATAPHSTDGERWVLAWPDPGELLVEDA